MLLKIDEKLRTLRAESKCTQKSLAAYLGVSEQAVSRWESGSCYPDIELLPAIACFFGITTDELLGYKKSEVEEEHILLELAAMMGEGRVDDAISRARSALAVMPDSMAISTFLVANLFTVGSGNIKDHKDFAVPLLEECVTLGKRILSRKDSEKCEMYYSVRSIVIRALCFLGRNSDGVEIAREAPSVYDSREFLIPLTLKVEDRLAYLKEVVGGVASLIGSVFIFCTGYGDDGSLQSETDIEMKEKYIRRNIALYDAMYSSVEDYFPEAKFSCFAYGYNCLKLSHILLKLGKTEESERWLTDAVEYILIADRSEEMRIANNVSLTALVDADHNCAGSRKDYEGKSLVYAILHGYINNGYLDGMDEAVIEKVRKRLESAQE